MTSPQLLNARLGELQLDLERQFEAGLAEPDPACCYHHGGEDGRFIYPLDCPGELGNGDVNREWRLL